MYISQGRLTKIESMYKRTLIGNEKILGRDHISILKTVNNLGNLYRIQSRLTDADSMLERVLIGFEKALGRDHTSTLATVHILGMVYSKQGRLTDAESMFERALAGHVRNPSDLRESSHVLGEVAVVVDWIAMDFDAGDSGLRVDELVPVVECGFELGGDGEGVCFFFRIFVEVIYKCE